MDIYSLSRSFWDYSFENPDIVKPNHCALYFYAIERCNRLGWKRKFSIPTTIAMESIGIKSYNTYIKTFNELVEIGFFTLHERSKNQHSANIIELSKSNKALDKALDKAMIKHESEQSESTIQSTRQSNCSIDIPITNTQIHKSTSGSVFSEESEAIQNILPDTEFGRKDISSGLEDSDECVDLTNEICSFFLVSEMNQPENYRKIGNFVRLQESKDRIEYLKKQFNHYKESKKDVERKYIHSWYRYIGDAKNSYEDGVWNIKDWSMEVKEESKPLVLPERTKRHRNV